MKSILNLQTSFLAAIVAGAAQLAILYPPCCSAQTNCTPRPPGLVAWWPGDGVGLDVVGTNRGTLMNGATFAPGKVGQAFSFDGVGGYVQIPNSASLDMANNTPLSVALWANRTGTAGTMHLIGKRDGCAGGCPDGIQWQIAFDGSGLQFGPGHCGVVTGLQMPLNAWTHLAGTFDGSTFRFYVNGLLVSSAAGSLGSHAGSGIEIARSGTCGGLFQGLIDEVAIFNRALSAAEIAAIYAAGTAGKCFTNDPSPIFVQQPISQVSFLDNTVSFMAFAMGSPRPTYQWLFNGVPLPGATNLNMTVAHLDLTKAGAYSVVASSASGLTTSQVARLTVLVPPFPTQTEQFEPGFDGWTTDNPALWQVGVPTFGPPLINGSRAHSGTNVSATLLGANYPANSSGRLISPRFIVPAVAADERVVLRFYQWYQYGVGDAGAVQIAQTTAATNWTPLAISAPNGASSSWSLATVDLTSYQGQEVRLAFFHSANGDGSVGAGWYIDDVSLSQIAPYRIALSSATPLQFTTNGQSQYFVVTAPPGGHLRIHLNDADHLGINEIYVRRGSLPTAGSYDYRFNVSGADQNIFVPNAGAGDWFIMAYNDSGPVPGDYTLQVDFTVGVILDSLAPAKVGNSLPSSVTINGAGFSASDAVALVNGVNVYPAGNVFFVSASKLIADFNFPAIPTNTYQLRVTGSTNSDSLPFQLIAGLGPNLETKLVVPSRVGYHAVATLYVEFKNTGNAAMPAPLLEVGATQNGRAGAWLTLTDHRLVEGFWTSATPEGFAHSVQFLASGATPGLLQPGESGRVPVYYAGWQQNPTPPIWDFSYPPIYFNLGVLKADNTNAVDWAALKDAMRPGSLTAEQWEPVFWNLVLQTGPTWGDYVKMLNDNARYLYRLGESVTDIRDLLGFEVMQASGLSVTRTLASAVDAQVQTPGLPLTLTRSFSTDIPSHFTLGRLGRGWSDNWDRSLTNAADGTVTIFGPGGSRRIFQPDSRDASHYFPPAGDSATLTRAGNSLFWLKESDGTRYFFRADGKLGSVSDPHNNYISCTYSGNSLTRLTHSAGPYLDLAYSGSRLASVTDSLGRQTVFTYDGSGEHLQTARDYRNQTTTYAYDLSLLTSAATHALTNIFNADGTESHYAYDGFGRLIKKAGCCGSPECTTFSYDSAGRITATDALTNSTQYYFDHRGLLVRTENPLGGLVHRTFDADGRLVRVTDAAGRSRTFTYDSAGNLSSETDALGYPTRYTYTADFNRLASVLDANGHLTRYAYEPDGDLASITYPDGSHEDWTYDGQGNRVSWTNRRRQTITYTNDVLGRVMARRYPDGVVHTFNYDAQGNLAGYTDPLGATTQGFDADGRLAKITYPGNRWLGYTYDIAGRRASMTNELGYATYYHYDVRGRLERLTDERGSNIVVYAYDTAGRMALKTLGNGVYTTYTYDPAGQLLDLFNHKPDGSVLSRFQYTYDSRGRRATMTTTYGAGDPRTSLAGLWRYDYDDTGQLIGWTAPWGRRVDYTYDALGNRLNVRDNGTNTAYTVNNLNQYTQVGSTAYQYDADGNLTNKVAPEGATAFSWSAENKLNVVTALALDLQNSFDAVGNRVRVADAGTVKEYVLDQFRLGNVVGEYRHGQTRPIAVFNHTGGLSSRRTETITDFYAFGSLSSTSELVADANEISAAYAYLPFGELLFSSETATNQFRFAGGLGVSADSSSLAYMRARHYDTAIGRFLSPDPLGLNGGDVNLYRYAANNSPNRVDPTGLSALEQCWNWVEPIVRWRTGDPGTPTWVPPWLKWKFPWLDPWRWPDIPLCREFPDWENCKDLFPPQRQQPPNEHPAIPDPTFRPWCYPGWPDWPGDTKNPDICPSGTVHGKSAMKDASTPADPCEPGPPVPPTPPIDPNALTGPKGFGTANFVSINALLPYMVEFENATNALVPAQQVVVSDRLTNLLDWTTFELTEIAFGDHFIAVPPKSQHYETTLQLSAGSYQFQVQIEAGIHLDTGEVYARFQSLNPTNGLPPPVDIGFLPPEPPHNPNDTPPVPGQGRGQGHLSYTIRAKTNLATSTEIRNVANISFDQQPAIATDLNNPHDPNSGHNTNKQALVTIDADSPSSSIINLPATAPGSTFTVNWGGSDAGAGIAGYDVYVQTNYGPWNLWLANTPGTSGVFQGRNGQTYCFYTIARDGAGNVQTNAPSVVCTQTLTNYPPVFDPVPDQRAIVNAQLVVTNVAHDPDQPLSFSLLSGPAGAAIDATNGIFRWTPRCDQGSSTNLVVVCATDSGSPSMTGCTNFWVIVPECIEASLGNTVMLAGQTSAVPVRLLSTTELTNMAFTVVYPAERFTNFALAVSAPEVVTQWLREVQAGQMQVSFTLASNLVLHGPTNVGQLGIAAVAGQSSAFVPLAIANVTGLRPDGNSAANAYGQPGRVVVVGQEPLLEATAYTNQYILLTLYGQPGSSNLFQWKTNVLDAIWQTGQGFTLTNVWQSFEVPATAPQQLFRALKVR